MPVQLYKTNVFRLLFEILRIRCDDQQLENLLDPISQAIRQSGARIDEWSDAGQDLYDAIVDDECANIEDLLGVAFVISQRYIAAVCSTVKRIHQRATTDGATISFAANDKRAVMRHGHASGDPSPVEVINAFANYFKHSDEWPYQWPTTGPGSDTARVIKHAGATQGSTGNFRAGARYLGDPDYHDLKVFAAHVASWRSRIHDDYEKELDQAGLLKAEPYKL